MEWVTEQIETGNAAGKLICHALAEFERTYAGLAAARAR
jgi:hypothetical protein